MLFILLWVLGMLFSAYLFGRCDTFNETFMYDEAAIALIVLAYIFWPFSWLCILGAVLYDAGQDARERSKK